MSTVERLIAHLGSDSAIAAALTSDGVLRVFEGMVPEGTPTPYVWLTKRGETPWEFTDVLNGNPFQEFVDLEVWGDPADTLSDSGVATLIRRRLHGEVSVDGVQLIQVLDADSEYVYRGASGDEGTDATAFDVQVTNEFAEV